MWLWDYLTRDLTEQIKALEKVLSKRDKEKGVLENTNLKKDIIITELKEKLKLHSSNESEEDFWNLKYPHNIIRYKAQGDYFRDIRTLINYPSYIADEVVLFNGLKKENEESTILAILSFIVKNVKYTSDTILWKSNEYWSGSDITIQLMKGDCDDMAIMFKALSLAAGIPDYKVKIVAGMVTNKDKVMIGHAYPIYLYKGEWKLVDCTFYPDYRTSMENRIHAKNDDRYNNVWFTFNKKITFSQKTINL